MWLAVAGVEQLAYVLEGHVLEGHAPIGEVDWDLKMMLLWPHSWKEFVYLFSFLFIVCYSMLLYVLLRK